MLAWGVSAQGQEAPASAVANIELWHTFAVDSLEEDMLVRAVDAFEAAQPEIDVTVTRIPYQQNLPQFINSSQGGEAPDIIRLADAEVGRIGHISVEGLPLLEDLRPHLTPAERSRFAPSSLAAMRYGEPLFAIPVSQGCLSLIYNRALFDAAGVAYPNSDWTTDDLLAAALALSSNGVKGISLPLKWSYWFVPFQSGFGGQPFDDEGRPTLDSPGTAQAVEWFLDLERVHDVVASGISLEAMSTQFMLGKSAMVLDGPWNWNSYLDAGLDIGVALMPIVAETGRRMRPVVSYFGWSVSKQSEHKVASVKLALWLSGSSIQKENALATYRLPTDISLASDPEVARNPVLAGFLAQSDYPMTIPTTRASSMMFEQLDTALEMTYTGVMTAQAALEAADAELEKRLAH